MAWLTAIDTLWRGLRRPWVLIASAGLLVLLLVGGLLLPQLPGQLSGDPTAAARWLLGVSAEYGPAGEMLRGLGLFNVLHSFLLQMLLAVLTLVLCVYLGDLVATALRYRQLPALLAAPVAEPGSPLLLDTAQTLYRRRATASEPFAQVTERLHTQLADYFEQLTSANGAVTALHDLDEQRPADPATSAPPLESRLLATRHLPWATVRLALMVGLLLAVLAVWRIVISGWELSAPVLVPGGSYRSANHGVSLHYLVHEGDGETIGELSVQVGEQVTVLPVNQRASSSVNGVEIASLPALPGLYVSTMDGEAELARAGQSKRVAGVGLTFPGPGSEEAVILPAQAIGLRIVRLSDEMTAASGAQFLLEIFRGEETQPAERFEIGVQPLETVPLNEDGLTLRLAQLPGMAVEARYLPGLWWLWVALGLVVAGGVGYWFRPSFALVQVAPWPVDRAVVTLQSDDANVLRILDVLMPTEQAEGAVSNQ
jgi:hypothetical protein